MSRLIDRVLRAMPVGALKTAIARDIVQVFDATNVAQYVFSGAQEGWDLIDDIPNLAPPFPLMWIECRAPLISTSVDGKGLSWDRNNLPASWGVYVQAEEIEAFCTDRGITADALKMEAKWVLFCILYAEFDKGKPAGPLFSWYLPITSEGKIVMRPSAAVGNEMRPYFKTSTLDPDATADQIHEEERYWLLPFICCMLAISFLHCKNVVQLVQVPPAKAKKEAKKLHGRPLLNYKVLQIEPMKKILIHEGQSGTKGLRHALSICRGHFKTFDQKGLFGKYTGTYWWNSHVRGSAEHGTVVHDYKVLAPKEDSNAIQDAQNAQEYQEGEGQAGSGQEKEDSSLHASLPEGSGS